MARNKSGGRTPSNRQLKVAEFVRRTLSDVLARGDVHDPELTARSITVGEVRISPDLRVADAYVLPLGGEGREAAMEALERNKSELRRAVARVVRLKRAPELRFVADESFDRMEETRRLLAREDVRRDLEGPADEGV